MEQDQRAQVPFPEGLVVRADAAARAARVRAADAGLAAADAARVAAGAARAAALEPDGQ